MNTLFYNTYLQGKTFIFVLVILSALAVKIEIVGHSSLHTHHIHNQ